MRDRRRANTDDPRPHEVEAHGDQATIRRAHDRAPAVPKPSDCGKRDDALRAIGVVAVYADEGVSGAKRDRDGLNAALEELQPGDALAVVALDRLGRDLSDLVRIVETLRERGAHLRSLRESIDTTTAAGRMLLGIFGALAEYERAMIQERTAERLAAKKARGERVGRKPALTPSQIALARRELAAGVSAAVVARSLHCGRSTLYRACRHCECDAKRNVCTVPMGGSCMPRFAIRGWDAGVESRRSATPDRMPSCG